MSVQITPGRELESEPARGGLPFDATLLFFASATRGSVTVDVVYRIVETDGQPIHVGFAARAAAFEAAAELPPPTPVALPVPPADAPAEPVATADDDPLVLRKPGVVLTALPQAIAQPVRLADTGGAQPPLLVMIQASLVEPGAPDDSAALDRTAAVIKIEAPAAGPTFAAIPFGTVPGAPGGGER